MSGEPLPHLRRLGAGGLVALGVPGKAALLDVAAAGGLPVPPGVVLRERALAAHDVDTLARQVVRVAPAARVAVRSAFATEDGTTTANAGRFTSVLDVDARDLDAVADALARVLGSAEDGVERAVLVQAMVPAVRAGVAFTERDHEDDLVDHVDGLAEDLVAGREAGERERLPRLAPLERGVGGWRGRLQVLLRDVRRVVGPAVGDGDWDVEWADDGRTCWLVQVRPVTVPPLRDAVLTLANHREILPDPPSVLMTSLVVSAGDASFGYWRGFAPDLPASRPFVVEHAGRPLIDLSLLTDTMRRLGLPTAFVTDSMGGSTELDAHVGPRPLRLAAHAPALVGLGLDQLRSPGAVDERVADLRARAREVDRDDVTAGEVLDAARDVYVGLVTGMFALTTAISGPLAVLQRLGVSDEHHARHRSAGTQVWDDLAPLRQLVDADPARREAVRAGEVPEDPTFAAAWRRFLEQHGHRGVHESDLSRPRYHEDPTPLLAVLAGRDRRAERAAAGADVPPRTALGVVTLPLWWQASRAIRAREDLRAGAMRAFDVLRRRLRHVGRRAVAAGALPEVDDVFDLTVEEVRALDAGATFDAAHLATRRAERERVARLRLPDVVRASDDPATYDPASDPGGGTGAPGRWRGLPLTRGEVTGVVWRADAPAVAAPPEVAGPADAGTPVVLVAPAVDAGWIATFAQVDAVVVETGGELSHGSIVLREAGVPAVTNAAGVAHPRRGLVTGDRVTVRAAAGVVERT
ncbi:MAG: PEP-utilizing enzyme [Actinomycetes bacterium]